MITARNYAAQAQYDLNKNSQLLQKVPGYSEDVKKFKALADMIGESVHFALPDNAKIISDDLQGIKNTEVRLPYPAITVEYFTHDSKDPDPNLIYVPKRLVLAFETTKEVVERMTGVSLKDTNNNWILIFSVLNGGEGWIPLKMGWALNSNWDNTEGSVEIRLVKEATVGFSGIPFAVLTDHLEKTDPTKLDWVVKSTLRDISSEVHAVLELCEALSCSNVKHEVMDIVDTVKNAKRIKQGKLPFYETRMLVVQATNNKTYSTQNSGISHKSPRQHLRRGHIRRLQNEKKIWVNSCIVGSSDNGVIKKQYSVVK